MFKAQKYGLSQPAVDSLLEGMSQADKKPRATSGSRGGHGAAVKEQIEEIRRQVADFAVLRRILSDLSPNINVNDPRFIDLIAPPKSGSG
jgi:hypothetical protein